MNFVVNFQSVLEGVKNLFVLDSALSFSRSVMVALRERADEMARKNAVNNNNELGVIVTNWGHFLQLTFDRKLWQVFIA